MEDLRRRGAGQHIVILADRQMARRHRLVGSGTAFEVVEAASLSEVYPLAEEMRPDAILLSAEFLIEPELEGVERLAAVLDARLCVYAEGRVPVPPSGLRAGLDCVDLQPGDTVERVLARAVRVRPAAAASQPQLLLIGASTGGVTAIEVVLTAFPGDCPPTLVVQHMRGGYVQGLVRRLESKCRPRIVEAVEGERLERGRVYFATDTERHLVLTGKGAPRLAFEGSAPRQGHRPAVDPLFESALPWAGRTAAALLTGMGCDGAAGLGALRRAGAFTIAQNQATSVVWGMPRAAIEENAATAVLPIDQIAGALLAGKAALESRGAR